MTLLSRIRALFSSWDTRETPNTITVGQPASASLRDRYPYDRAEVLDQSLEAWRTNPLARRIIGLTTQYVVGGGIAVSCKHRKTNAFLQSFWANPLNRMQVRCAELCDELSRTGNLFILLTTDAAGMSYLRAVPASMVEEITARENDIEQPVSFKLSPFSNPDGSFFESRILPACNVNDDNPGRPVILHYAINRPAGAQWGEPDLAPLLRWLARYSNWLEDRARLNRFRNSFLFVVKGKFLSETQRLQRQAQLNASPPAPGSILVASDTEEWTTIAPNLDAPDAATDGLALKKMIAAGAGLPLHFLAEPESATRTTAEAAGGPTYRHFEQRQEFFLWVLQDILQVVLRRRAFYDRYVKPDEEITVTGADISARDNSELASASAGILSTLVTLRDRSLIDDAELLRLVYRFAGEPLNIEDMLARGKAAQRLASYEINKSEAAQRLASYEINKSEAAQRLASYEINKSEAAPIPSPRKGEGQGEGGKPKPEPKPAKPEPVGADSVRAGSKPAPDPDTEEAA
ncbi:MAG: hypothetical protein IT308_07005 [Anaerolineaceae bacterium]|nr:hypothetical protein [Anaerolineaceae bacterium]